jgi:pimeloyl-ACP methyl ester carboxylesterase
LAAAGRDVRSPPDSIAVMGAADRLNPPDTARPLLEQWGAVINVLDNVGHLPFIEDRETFRTIITSWIEKVDVAC